ncbi:MAG: hypothetical protein ACKO0Z_11740 [Betaproteobacteria bacterium]
MKLLILTIFAISQMAFADAYVCKNGKATLISTEPCPPNSRTSGTLKSANPITENEYARRAQQEVDRMQSAADQMRNERYRKSIVEQSVAMEMQQKALVANRRNTPPPPTMDIEIEESAPKSQSHGLIDPYSGTYMPSNGAGGFINPRTGGLMQGVAGGVIDTRTGRFIPTH